MITIPKSENWVPSLDGLLEVPASLHEDSRGSFSKLVSAKARLNFMEISYSTNLQAGAFRGFHGLRPDLGESKIVSVLDGELLSFALDFRPSSPTFLKHTSRRLTPNGFSLLFPPGILHGYLTISERSSLMYAMTCPYDAGAEIGVWVGDPALAMRLAAHIKISSRKDESWPLIDSAKLSL